MPPGKTCAEGKADEVLVRCSSNILLEPEMTITLADGEGRGGGLESLDASDEMGLLSVDQGIDALEGMFEKARGWRCDDRFEDSNSCVEKLPRFLLSL